MNKLDLHAELCRELTATYKQKNAAYGDSFGKSVREWGIAAAAVRMGDKFHRFENLAKHPELDPGDEQINDTLMDLANYALMTIIEQEAQREKGEQTWTTKQEN